ncbi:hypothetical protein SB761_36180, partial [Pseudomonas sp. SIMBA_064]
VKAVDPAGKSPLDDSITCLARTIYWEAKGADAKDMTAVASVVLNRLGDDRKLLQYADRAECDLDTFQARIRQAMGAAD